MKNGEFLTHDKIYIISNDKISYYYDTKTNKFVFVTENSIVSSNAYKLEDIANEYLELDITLLSENKEEKEPEQESLFDMLDTNNEVEQNDADLPNKTFAVYAYVIGKSREKIVFTTI